ncbi:MAG: type IA DNA topoisomerase, partial [Clostridia bacterium]|nr:type IA DNA topoisomerase [Clostridia bacterium]
MIAIICEKPSQARNFAKALGGASGTFDGKRYTIVPARGHLYEFVDPDKQVPADKAGQYHSWDLKNLPWDESEFSWKREKKKDTTDVLRTLKTVLSTADSVYLGGDIDPSGEGGLISIEILDELRIRPKEIRRMYFYDESPKSIQDAFKKAKVIPDVHRHDEYLKAIYRTKFDFLTMQFTRIATAHGDGQSLLRQGRLKSAMVLITGDGLKAVAEYKKIPFYQNRFKDDKGNMYTSKDEPSFPDKAQVPKSYSQGTVTVDKKEIRKTAPPKLLDLAGLSSMLAGKGVKAKEVLDTYQKLYEANITSYPRTEDKTITPEQFDELLPLVDSIARVVGVDPGLLTHKSPRKTHVKTGGAHGANRPGTSVPSSLKALESYGKCAPQIYEILARNYLAMLCEDYEYESQSGHVTEYPVFVGSCSVPVKQGWKQVFQSGDEEDDAGKGLGTVANPFVHEGFPPKPPTPTMKWLMKQWEKHDVGTGATRTSTYSDVTNDRAKYPLMKESRGKITLTKYGEMSYRLLPGTHIGSLDLTEEVQNDMRLIAEGKLDGDEALKKIQRYVIEDRDTMK